MKRLGENSKQYFTAPHANTEVSGGQKIVYTPNKLAYLCARARLYMKFTSKAIYSLCNFTKLVVYELTTTQILFVNSSFYYLFTGRSTKAVKNSLNIWNSN